MSVAIAIAGVAAALLARWWRRDRLTLFVAATLSGATVALAWLL